MMIEEDLTLGGEHTVQHRDDVLQNCTHETHIILLTNVTLIHLINFLKEENIAFVESLIFYLF